MASIYNRINLINNIYFKISLNVNLHFWCAQQLVTVARTISVLTCSYGLVLTVTPLMISSR